jgi:O-methyltransferase involved in polyketide biosynthesis
VIKNLTVVFISIILGAGLCAYISEPVIIEVFECDVTEHARIKMALAECADAAMVCAWGEDYKEVVLEEE